MINENRNGNSNSNGNDNGTPNVPEGAGPTETPKRIIYPENWTAYNYSQTHEKEKLPILLSSLCLEFLSEEPRTGRGRPPIPLRDAIFIAVYKVYLTLSGRRCWSDMIEAEKKGYIKRLPHFNSIFKVLEKKETTEVLKKLIEETAKPFESLESHFAVDASGFHGTKREYKNDQKPSKDKNEKEEFEHIRVKAHIMIGVESNVITAAEIPYNKYIHDSQLFEILLYTTALQFNIKEISGDKAYCTEKNLQAAVEIGAIPYIAFKSNATTDKGGVWAKYLNLYLNHHDEYMSRYHLRSNIETTFSMVKKKFGKVVRSKTDTAMINEVLAKFLCHNLCCLIEAIYKNIIQPIYWGETARRKEYVDGGNPNYWKEEIFHIWLNGNHDDLEDE